MMQEENNLVKEMVITIKRGVMQEALKEGEAEQDLTRETFSVKHQKRNSK